MIELQVRRVEGNAVDAPFQLLIRTVLTVPDDGVADCGHLDADLICQSGHQRDSDKRCAFEALLHGVTQLRASRFGIALGGHPLKHPFLPEVMHECPLLDAEMTANNGEILPHGRVLNKLLDEGFSICPRFGKEQNAGREAIDAMHDIRLLPPGFQLCREKRERRRIVRVIGRHRKQFGWLIQDDHGLILVKDAELTPVRLP